MDRSRERERGEYRFPCSFMFSVYWLIQRQCWIIHIACFPIFFVRSMQERKKIFHMTINLCLVQNKTRGMEPQWSPCKAFSLTDIETIVVWSVSFSIIWQRHWERIGKILSSNCKHVLKVRGEYQRFCLHEVFIQLYKTGAGWICQLSINKRGSWFWEKFSFNKTSG